MSVSLIGSRSFFFWMPHSPRLLKGRTRTTTLILPPPPGPILISLTHTLGVRQGSTARGGGLVFAGVTQAVTGDAAMRQLPEERGFGLCHKDPGLESLRRSSRLFRPNRSCRDVTNSRCQQRRHVANIERVLLNVGWVTGVLRGLVGRIRSIDSRAATSMAKTRDSTRYWQ